MIGFILGTSEGKKILSLINKHTDNIAVSHKLWRRITSEL